MAGGFGWGGAQDMSFRRVGGDNKLRLVQEIHSEGGLIEPQDGHRNYQGHHGEKKDGRLVVLTIQFTARCALYIMVSIVQHIISVGI